MLEHAIYSVISPEGCASILWRSADKAQEAATALKITAQDLLQLKIIDAIVPEPVGGAHRAPQDAIDAVADQIAAGLKEMEGISGDELLRQRRAKFLAMGRNL
jgi:acetyl-CoA carboxylase carboxyl transferase subunit alpha